MQDKLKQYGAIALICVMAAVIVVLGYLYYQAHQAAQESPKIIQYEQTTQPQAMQKYLGITPAAAQEITKEIQYIHDGQVQPVASYTVQAPSTDKAAEVVAAQIKNKDSTIPKQATAKSDRTVVTAGEQAVDVYKINLAHKHAIYGGGGYDNGLRGAVSVQIGDSLTTVTLGNGKPGYYEQYKILRW